MKRSHLFYFSSKHGKYPNPGSISRFNITMPDVIAIASDERAFISVRHAEIPNTIDQVTNENNLIVITLLGLPNNIEIPEGTYTGTQLAETFQTQINESAIPDNTVLIEYSQGTGKFSLSNLTPFNINVDFSHGDTSNLFGHIEAIIDMAANDVLISDFKPDLMPNSVVALNTDLNLYNTYSSRNNGRSTILELFPIGEHAVKTSYVNASNIFRCELKNNHISTIELWLTDEEGKEIVMDATQHWSVSLLLEIEPF